MSVLPPIPPDITSLAAPRLFEGLWNWCLYGVLVVQLYVYSYNFPEDKKFLKLLVYTVFFLESLQTTLNGADLYYWFVSGFGDVRHLIKPYASAFDVAMIEPFVSLSVQYYFAYRIWVLSQKESRRLCFIICLCSTISAAAAFTGFVYTQVHDQFPQGAALMSMTMGWFVPNAIADVLICIAMLHHLARRMDKDGTFRKIVRVTIETNLLTTTVGIVALLMVAIFPQESWFICPTGVIGKVYSNTLLVSLNNRISIREAAVTQRVAIRSPAAIIPITPLRVSVGDPMIRELPSSSAGGGVLDIVCARHLPILPSRVSGREEGALWCFEQRRAESSVGGGEVESSEISRWFPVDS